MGIYKYRNKGKADIWIKGKKVLSKTGFTIKKDAENIINFRNSDPTAPKPPEYIFNDLYDRFVNVHLPTVRHSTKVRYNMDMTRRIKPAFQYVSLKKIDPFMIERFRSNLLKTGNISLKSIKNTLDLLRLMLNKGVKWQMMDKNSYNLEPLKIPNIKYKWWDKKEYIIEFLKTARQIQPHYYAAYRVALECGMRVGEIVGLSKQDVDLNTCTIHVHRQWLDKEKRYGPTKHNKERFIKYSPSSDLGEVLAKAIKESPDPEVIFVTSVGTRVMNRKLAAARFQTVVKHAKVPLIRFHDLRHTFASWYMIEVGDIWSLKGILGHSDIKTTQRYAHLSNMYQKPAVFDWISQNKTSNNVPKLRLVRA